jgi:hypothetical protein
LKPGKRPPQILLAGKELPEEFSRQVTRPQRIREAKRALEQKAREEAKEDAKSKEDTEESKP